MAQTQPLANSKIHAFAKIQTGQKATERNGAKKREEQQQKNMRKCNIYIKLLTTQTLAMALAASAAL